MVESECAVIWSRLNPNAAAFVPVSAYREVEDFSDQWWDLVHTTPLFRDYWIQERFLDPQNAPHIPSIHQEEVEVEVEVEEEEEDYYYYYCDGLDDGASLGLSKRGSGWGRGTAEIPKYSQKAPKMVRVKVRPRPRPRPIHQPR
ncbi:hypothetical protein Syun_000151 [Stephania yunnanensis]|uniref:Uncharacterized protein n=1 Tax=Stephania yunnanensis TaxID=152371 RepID=A0AAP0Q9K3_9MAGN